MTTPDTWRISSYSNGQANCVEVAPRPGAVAVRDTKDRDGGTLVIGTAAWCTFGDALRARAWLGSPERS